MVYKSADIAGLLRAFAERRVRFVVIGGVSAALQGVPAVTFDVDIVLDPEPGNLDSAFELLRALSACFREHLPAKILEPQRSHLESDGAMLLMTELGPLDILGMVATGWRYPQLHERSRTVKLDEQLEIEVVELAALIEIKEAVGREKDHAVLPLYRRVLREQKEGGS